MKLILKIFAFIALIAAIQPTVQAEPSSSVTVTTLTNGMKIIVREGHEVNLAAVDVWVKAGSINETADTNGISHFVEHMIFKTTSKYAPGEIDREIEGLGSELNGGTSKDWVHFYTVTASEYLPIAINVVGDAITSAQFRPEDVEKERQVLLDEIARFDSDPLKQAFSLFSNVAYAVHPYSLSPTGTKAVISKLTRDELFAYYRNRYKPENICVVITGDVSSEKVVSIVQQAFSALPKTSGVPVKVNADPPIEPAPSVPRAVKYKMPVNQTQVILGFRGASASDLKDLCALDIMLSILGDTSRGRIASALTSAGVHFTNVDTDFITQKYPAMFSVYAALEPGSTDDVASIILTELRRLTVEPVSVNELFQAKRLVEGSDLFQHETFSGQARSFGLYESVGSWELSMNYAPAVRSITSDDIMSVAARYFSKDNYCLVVIEPEAEN
ncbi:MAG: M16 family metallopeptidase [Armatimonadota bacterium]